MENQREAEERIETRLASAMIEAVRISRSEIDGKNARDIRFGED